MIEVPRGKVAITPIFDPDRTKGGLFIPDQAKERCDQGIIKYVSAEEEFFEPGDYVLFSAYDGTLVQLEGEGLLIFMHSDALVCKISPPEYLNTVMKGLYFRTDSSVTPLAKQIAGIFGFADHKEYEDRIRNEIIEWETDKYFNANYEQALSIMSENLTELGYPNRFRFKDRKQSAPKSEEIKKYGR